MDDIDVSNLTKKLIDNEMRFCLKKMPSEIYLEQSEDFRLEFFGSCADISTKTSKVDKMVLSKKRRLV